MHAAPHLARNNKEHPAKINSSEVLDRYDDVYKDAAPEIPVFLDEGPEGLRYDGYKLVVEDGFQHEVLSKLELNPGPPLLTSLLMFPNYTSTGRKIYCYPQTILTYGTLVLWSIFSPLAYPCWGAFTSPKSELIAKVQHLTAAAGGDFAIIGYSDTAIAGSKTEARGLHGYIIRVDPRYTDLKNAAKQSILISKRIGR